MHPKLNTGSTSLFVQIKEKNVVDVKWGQESPHVINLSHNNEPKIASFPWLLIRQFEDIGTDN